jgi:hypothetical protein
MCLDAKGLTINAKPVTHKKPIKAWKGFTHPNQAHVDYDNKFIKCLDGEFRSVSFVIQKPSGKPKGKPVELETGRSTRLKVGAWNEDKGTALIYVYGGAQTVSYEQGYHVCATKADAEKYNGSDGFIVPVLVNDIVAEGTQSGANCLVAKKLYIDPADVPEGEDPVLRQHELFKKKYKY